MRAKADLASAPEAIALKPALLVADAVARTAARYGARYAFGIPGNDVLETVRACEDAGSQIATNNNDAIKRSRGTGCDSCVKGMTSQH